MKRKTPSLFNLLCAHCGLTFEQAALYLDTGVDNVKAWASGRRNCPPKILSGLFHLGSELDKKALDFARRAKRLKTPIDLSKVPSVSNYSGPQNALLARIIMLLPDDTDYITD